MADLIKIISQKKTAKIIIIPILLLLLLLLIIIIINLPSSFKSYLQPKNHYEKKYDHIRRLVNQYFFKL